MNSTISTYFFHWVLKLIKAFPKRKLTLHELLCFCNFLQCFRKTEYTFNQSHCLETFTGLIYIPPHVQSSYISKMSRVFWKNMRESGVNCWWGIYTNGSKPFAVNSGQLIFHELTLCQPKLGYCLLQNLFLDELNTHLIWLCISTKEFIQRNFTGYENNLCQTAWMGPEGRFQGFSQNFDYGKHHCLLFSVQKLNSHQYLIRNSADFGVPSILFMLEQLSELFQCDFTVPISVQLGHQSLSFLL